MKIFKGNVLFLDRSDINTDEIIPAKYLTEITKEALKSHCLEDLNLESFQHPDDLTNKGVIITRANFGCGSSREHAPWALEVNGINTVIAENFARIFRQNMYNCGMLAIELPAAQIDMLFQNYQNQPAYLETDLDKGVLKISSSSRRDRINFNLNDFGKALISSGGWVEYADRKY
ncbi:MAG TPA: 3-isopropylmalate dehydratase small subunit [Spirochaetota bacterium]|nr:3-isopropylmalate dehydratase small subunit [Spirochaetota bacterium]